MMGLNLCLTQFLLQECKTSYFATSWVRMQSTFASSITKLMMNTIMLLKLLNEIKSIWQLGKSRKTWKAWSDFQKQWGKAHSFHWRCSVQIHNFKGTNFKDFPANKWWKPSVWEKLRRQNQLPQILRRQNHRILRQGIKTKSRNGKQDAPSCWK